MKQLTDVWKENGVIENLEFAFFHKYYYNQIIERREIWGKKI